MLTHHVVLDFTCVLTHHVVLETSSVKKMQVPNETKKKRSDKNCSQRHLGAMVPSQWTVLLSGSTSAPHIQNGSHNRPMGGAVG